MLDIVLQDARLVEIFPAAILVLNQKGRIIGWNSAAATEFNLSPIIHSKLPIQQLIRKIVEPLNFPWELQQEIPAVLHDSPHNKLAITLLPYNQDYYVLLVRDTTHIHYLEQMRQDFVANVSHELRSPLTVIHGYLEVLLMQQTADSSEKAVLQQMLAQSVRMNELIADLLLLSRLEAQEDLDNQKVEINLTTLLTKIKSEAEALSGSRQHCIHLTIDQPNASLIGVESELHSAFANLVFNAVHYTPANGQIDIIWREQDGHPVLIVADTGIGFAKKHIARLTERFYRVDKARSRKSGGTGLGLAIVKHVLLRHNAHLVITSQPRKGSVFTCVFNHP